MAGKVISVAILAGGASRRMGEDKALLRIVPDGPTTIDRVIDVARWVSDDVFIVSPEDRDYSRFGLRIVADRFPGEGPLGGIVSALGATDRTFTLMLSCDHPFLSIPLLRWMSELPSSQLLLPETGVDGVAKLHPIHARYRQDALETLADAFASGERRLRIATSRLETRLIPESELTRFDPGLRSLVSVNTPEEADAAWRILSTRTRDVGRVANDLDGTVY
jgi:molybdopterin-guanine dinucleotide biosynthesis protein A